MAAYITTADLREYLTQIKVGVGVDAELTKVINRAHRILTDALGFEFAAYGSAATAKDVQARAGDEWLWVPYYKASSVTTVQSIGARGTSYESLSTVSNWKEEDAWRLYAYAGWTAGTWYRVTAIWGYGPVPDSVIEVELEVAVNLWRAKDAGVWQSETGAPGEGGTRFNRALSWPQRDVLNAVRAQYLGVVHA